MPLASQPGSIYLLAAVSFLISLGAVRSIEVRWGSQLLDVPNERSSHKQPTPRGGGLGFVVAFAIASAVFALVDRAAAPIFWHLWTVLLPLSVVGILDDRGNVPAGARYLVQLSAAGLAVYWFGAFPQPWLSAWGSIGTAIAWVLTAIGFTALVNFYNFMDGLDGLVAGSTALQLGFLATATEEPLWGLLVASLLGFLVRNWSPAKIFMGDVGSTVLGACVAIALLNVSEPAPAWTLLAVTLPLVGDAVYTLARRLLRGENIFQAHRTHLYQRLQQSGWSHASVAATYLALTATAALAIAALGSTGGWLCLGGEAIALSIGEGYLRSRQQVPA
ncbi:UDP-N-acetylmuramyl pentapeptide phosphotransferase [Rubidibacter lacunae KORDI 51-2]|uniref:UDP-N-acetylmuramyl pentapeptide phosphotransferase n=1 Tax=Rubidibacter lacunae KORDI 51-2 TaxID=582515 RepID=U5DN41_9CHRO|nr:glycosyltransferase family 4 protein [Rubidibacter lacunae]ERN42039.1 UDP-N-acetylmuramyl pentapeptide phosphotransferase [Rubidibacter lacunae KORDI 51-2]